MIPHRRFALLLAGLLLVAPAGLSPAAAETTADIFNGFQAKSTDPVHVDAGVLEISEEGKQRISVFRDKVVVRRGNTTLRAGQIKLYSPLDGSAADGFTRIEASGKVIVDSGKQTVSGETAVVDMKARTITVSGGVVLTQGDNIISGSRLVVNLATGQARVEQAPGQRIRGVFTPDAVQSMGKQ
jgi:lipopolysaccharide export system protein LptA